MCPSELTSNRAFRVLPFLLAVSMMLTTFQMGGALAQAAAPSDPGPSGVLRQVRSLDIDELQTARSEGLAYNSGADASLFSLLDGNAVRESAVNPENGHVFQLNPAAQAIQELTSDGKVIAS